MTILRVRSHPRAKQGMTEFVQWAKEDHRDQPFPPFRWEGLDGQASAYGQK